MTFFIDKFANFLTKDCVAQPVNLSYLGENGFLRW